MRAALAVLAACSSPSSVPSPRPLPISHRAIDAGVDAPAASQEERLAAIQKAMNELDEAVQGCWAVIATERFDVEGDLTAQIEIGATPAQTKASLVLDTARNGKLAACVVAVLEAYPWAPPLRGQTIRLPFRFRAPSDGQNVIDRALVSAAGQGDVRVSVLIDENNTSTALASMFAIAIAPKGTTGMRRAERLELWYFKTPAEVKGPGKPLAVAAGDLVLVPKNGVRSVRAGDVAVDAMLVMLPGGREGAARAGALPTPDAGGWEKTPLGPTLVPASAAKTYPRGLGKVTIQLDGTPELAASILEFPAGMAVPEHVHDKETELLYVLAGSGTMTVKGQALAITATSVVQIPPGTKHAFTTTTDLRAVQIYTPAGPEQRFKKP